MWVYNHLICAEIEIAHIDNQSPIFQPHFYDSCLVWGGLYTILGVLANFPKANLQKRSTHQKHQPEHFGHFMFGLTFW